MSILKDAEYSQYGGGWSQEAKIFGAALISLSEAVRCFAHAPYLKRVGGIDQPDNPAAILVYTDELEKLRAALAVLDAEETA